MGMNMTRNAGWVSLVLVVLVTILLVTPTRATETSFKYGGYVKFDAMVTHYNNGVPSALSPIREFHIPALVPVGDTNKNHNLDFHVKESRFNFQTLTTFEDGRTLKGYLEMDFLLSVGGDERVSNSFNPRMRHFYFATGPWLFGQTWMTFMVVILPDNLDFIGAPEGVIFGRQPQVRYTHGPWQFSLENPQMTVSDPRAGQVGSLPAHRRVVTGSSGLPDIVARRNFKGNWGRLGVAAIVRQLRYVDDTYAINDRGIGYGLTVGSEIKVGKDDLKFQATAGSGLGRYIGLNFVDAAVIDTTNGQLSTIDKTAGFIAYRHFWNEKWRSTVDASVLYADNPSLVKGSALNRDAQSFSVNLLYSPVPKWTVGLEFFHARRRLENGTDGWYERLQFSARWDFGYLSSAN
jgi:hypothetical protein